MFFALSQEAALRVSAIELSAQQLAKATLAAERSTALASKTILNLKIQIADRAAELASLSLLAAERSTSLTTLQRQQTAAAEAKSQLDIDHQALLAQQAKLALENAYLAAENNRLQVDAAAQLQQSQLQVQLRSQQVMQQLQFQQLEKQLDTAAAVQLTVQSDLDSALAASVELRMQRSMLQADLQSAESQAAAAAASMNEQLAVLEELAATSQVQASDLLAQNLALQAEAVSSLEASFEENEILKREAKVCWACVQYQGGGRRLGSVLDHREVCQTGSSDCPSCCGRILFDM